MPCTIIVTLDIIRIVKRSLHPKVSDISLYEHFTQML